MSDEKKKDLTSIFDLTGNQDDSSGTDNAGADNADTEDNAAFEIPDMEQIEDFATLDELPALDHVTEAPGDDPFAGMETLEGQSQDPELSVEGLEPMETPTADVGSDDSFHMEPAGSAPASDSAPAPSTMEQVRNFSEKVTPGSPVVEAAFPFSVLIDGKLTADEQEKLLDTLSRHDMGIREMDLEPQLEAGRILIPRISEYAAILLVQALRSANADIRMAPADEIFSTDDTRSSNDEIHHSSSPVATVYSDASLDPVENLPVSTEDALPGRSRYEVIDTVIATAALRTKALEAASSPEYGNLLEALQREIKYKAKRKGATAVIRFEVTLTPLLSDSTHYRVTATGCAVRKVEESIPGLEP